MFVPLAHQKASHSETLFFPVIHRIIGSVDFRTRKSLAVFFSLLWPKRRLLESSSLRTHMTMNFDSKFVRFYALTPAIF